MATKKSKKILFVIAGLGLAVFAYLKFLRKDKFGGRMTQNAGGDTFYNGSQTSGAFRKGSLGMANGMWTVRDNVGDLYEWRQNAWYKV